VSVSTRPRGVAGPPYAGRPALLSDHLRDPRMRAPVPFFVAFAVLLVLWEAAPSLFDVSPLVLPPPSDVLQALFGNLPVYAEHGTVTALELAAGFTAGSVVGFVAAIGIHYSGFFRRAVYPVLLGFRIVPKVAFVPLFLIWFGIGLASKMALATFAVFFLVLVQTTLGLDAVDREQEELGRSLRMSEWQMFRSVRLPVAMPSLMVGLKLGATYALTNIIMAEMAVANKGLGYVVVLAESQLATDEVIAAILVVAVVGLVLYGLTSAVEKRVTFWYGS
jgi:NitT/TauT family transport system permease protein